MSESTPPDSAAPSPRGRRSADWLASGLLLLAAAGLLRDHLLGRSLFLGNYDRLGYFLAARLSEFDALRAHGATSAWDDRMFMGFNSAALPGATSPLSPMRLVSALSSRPEFYYWAGVCVVALMALAGIAAYFCLRQLKLGPVAAWTGGLVYMCSTHSMIRLAQADTSSLLLAALPTGAWLVFAAQSGRTHRHAAGIAGLATLLFYSATGPPTIYLMGFWSALAVYRSWQTKTFAPMLACATGIVVGFIISAPHLWGVANELRGMVRDGGVGASFQEVYDFFNVRPHEWLRALDEGIFGRSPGEVAALGNNLNLSEGFQVYSSTFASLAIVALLLRSRGEWLRLFRMKDGLLSFFAWALVLLCAAVLLKPMVELTYLLFLKGKLIHARLSFIATLPAAILTGVAVQAWLAPEPDRPSRRTVVTLSIALLAATLLWLGLQVLADRAYAPARLEWWRPAAELVPAAVRLLVTGAASLEPAPQLPPSIHPVWLLSSRVVVVLGAFAIFALLAGLACWRPRFRPLAGQILLLLIVLQTLQEADQRWNGPENHSYPAPFAANNFFIAPANTLRSSHPAAAAELQARLAPDRYRTVFLPEDGQFHHFVAPHLTSYWQLRTVEGYLSGIPDRLAALDWPAGTAGFRTISFTNAAALPWPLLGVLNVRQAVVADTPLYFDTPRRAGADGGPALRTIENPAPVLPREFFAPRTVPGRPLAERARPILLDADAARNAPEVEGLKEEKAWATDGEIRAAYRGDRIAIALTASSQPRFLVLNELYHPRWVARAGATTLPVYPVNTVMRGVEIPAGVTAVEFEFRPYSRFAGWWLFPVTGAGLLSALLAWPWIAQRLPTRVRSLGQRGWATARRPEFQRWVVVAALSTALNLGLLYVLVDRLGVSAMVAPALSAMIGISARFLLTDRWVFGFARPSWRRWGEFHLATAGGFVAWWTCSALLTLAGLHYLIAACLAIGCSVGINAVLNFNWIWHPRRRSPRAEPTPPRPAPPPAPPPDATTLRRAWRIVLVAYVLLYAGLLLTTGGYPYVLDNNESYSSLWHARSLYENGVSETKGLTDEVFSTHPAASPYIHSHQGNFPRLFTWLLYLGGARTIESQIWLTTFTVGLGAIFLAFRFLTRLTHPRFAATACLVLMTNYLLFAQWQVSLYNVWHAFFFFSSLLVAEAVAEPEPSPFALPLAFLNFAALFYWEYVFTAFLTVLCVLWVLGRHWRRPRAVLRVALVMGAGAGTAAVTLLGQLTAYMGWSNVLEDVRLTLTARNAAADQELLAKVTGFYREHRIIFWHNFLDATPLRSFAALWDSAFHHHLRHYSGPLFAAMALVLPGWLAGLVPGPLAGRRRGPIGAAAYAAGFAVIVGILIAALFPSLTLPSRAAAAVAATAGLGWLWTGRLWPWARLGWRRLAAAALFAAAAVWLIGTLRGDFVLKDAEGEAISGLRAELGRLVPPLAVALGLACALLGNRAKFGRERGAALGRLPFLLLCGVAAYLFTYRIFTGYIYSGYLHRQVPLLVFLTDLLLALALYAAWPRAGRRRAARWASGLAVALLVGLWADVQVRHWRTAPPDSYAFLNRLDGDAYRGLSLISNTYPAPMAYRTGAWGYADPTLFSGILRLGHEGFVTERDLKYLWFADRDTNPAYLKPDLAIMVVQVPNLEVAAQLERERREAPPGQLPLVESPGLMRRSAPLEQSMLVHRLDYTDHHKVSFVRLDWDYPPFLRADAPAFLPAATAAPLAQRLALSRTTQNLRRHWRVALNAPGPGTGGAVGGSATIDGRPVFATAEFSGLPPATVVTGDALELALATGPTAGRVEVEINSRRETVDLRTPEAGTRVFHFSSAYPYGRYTYVPAFTPGLCVRTDLVGEGGETFAEIAYHYAHQDSAPESGTAVRLYEELADGRTRVAATVVFLRAAGVAIELEKFRAANPETVREHARQALHGDKRTYLQWLEDHLAAHPDDRDRAGLHVAAGGTPGDLVVRRLPLPTGLAGKLRFAVTPATRTKAGPEYFGLPFSAADVPHSGRLRLDYQPPAADAAAALDFGTLHLRLRFPRNRTLQSEPLVTTGVEQAGDFVYVIYVDDTHIRIGFDHWFRGGPVTAPIPIDFDQAHDLEISLGSLFPSSEDIAFVGRSPAEIARLKERILVRLDGQTVIDSATECYEAGYTEVSIGRNDIRGTSSGPAFTGTIESVTRSWPESP